MSDHHVDAALASKPLARAVASAFGKPGLLAAAGLVLSPSVFAATYTVGNLNDSGSSSLRDAIAQANANPGADTITFASNVSGTITLTSGSLHIYDAVDIQGPGAGTLTIDGGFSTTKPSSPNAYGGYSDIVIGGGVAANTRLRAMAEERGAKLGIRIRVPRPGLCTDNGAMVAALGAEMVARGRTPSDLDVPADSSQPVTHVLA